MKFKPKSGAATICEKCKTTCDLCGGVKRKGTHSNLCFNCGISLRSFESICIKCGKKFKDTNGLSKYCKDCGNSGFCIDCGVPIKKKSKRCNSCARKYSHKKGIYRANGNKKYEYCGVKYRSSWQLDFAKTLTSYNIPFEYEKYDEETKTRPDFYFKKRNLYLEIHPVKPHEKVIPSNCVLVTTKENANAFAKVISFKDNLKDYSESLCKMTKDEILKEYRQALDLCCYLKQRIMEEHEKGIEDAK